MASTKQANSHRQHSTNELKVFVAVGKSRGRRTATLMNHGLEMTLHDSSFYVETPG